MKAHIKHATYTLTLEDTTQEEFDAVRTIARADMRIPNLLTGHPPGMTRAFEDTSEGRAIQRVLAAIIEAE